MSMEGRLYCFRDVNLGTEGTGYKLSICIETILMNKSVNLSNRMRRLNEKDEFECPFCGIMSKSLCEVCKGLGRLNYNSKVVRLIEQVIQRKNQAQQPENDFIMLISSEENLIKPHQNLQASTASHTMFYCDGCLVKPIQGDRFTCETCEFDLCSKCKDSVKHQHELKRISLTSSHTEEQNRIRELMRDRMCRSSIVGRSGLRRSSLFQDHI